MDSKEVSLAVAAEISAARAAVLPWFARAHSERAWLPAHGRWSIEEILHHIALTNHYLLILIDKAAAKSLKAMLRGENLDWPADYALIPLALEDAKRAEAFTWHRPEHMDPRIHPAQGEDVQARIVGQMAKLEDILTVLPAGWGHWQKTTMSVNDLGKLDVYQFIVFLCKHTLRHCAQMEGNLREMQGQ